LIKYSQLGIFLCSRIKKIRSLEYAGEGKIEQRRVTGRNTTNGCTKVLSLATDTVNRTINNIVLLASDESNWITGQTIIENTIYYIL
jgi:hypothetical protein